MKRWLLRAVDVRPGEELATALLLVYSFFLGLLVAFFYSVASALFLADFDMRRLPEAYIYAGALGFVVVQGFSRLERRWPLGRLLVVNLAFLILLVAAFRWGIVATDARWLSFALFLWIDPVLTLAQLGFWGLAGRLFDLQQSKRLFGLVGSGEVVAEILGFLLVPVLIRMVSSPSDLLVLAVVGLGGSLVVLVVMLRRFGGTLERRPPEGIPGEAEEGRPREHATLRGRYIRLLAASAAVLVVVVYFLDFGFLSVVDQQLEGDPVQLASFLGVFWGVTELAELLFKLAASGRLLRTFGMVFGLLAYPLAVLGTMVLAVAAASLLGSESLPFFVLVVLAKLVGFVLQRSLFEPSSRVLFQPLPEELRFAAQARIEGGVKQAALVGAGLLLLLVAYLPSLGLAQVVQILLFLLLGWSGLLVLIHREYRAKLMQALAERPRRDLVPEPADVLRGHLFTMPLRRLPYVLDVLARVEPVLSRRWVEELTEADDPAVRALALDRLEDGGSASALAPSEATAELLWDVDPRKRQRALARAGRAGSPELWPRLIDELAIGENAKVAAEGLVELGPPVLPILEQSLRRFDGDAVMEPRLVRVVGRIPGPEADRLLFKVASHPRRGLALTALTLLTRRGCRAPAALSGSLIEKMERMIDRVAWLSAAKVDLDGTPEAADLVTTLDGEVREDRMALLLLLGLLTEPKGVELLREHLEESVGEVRAYALEVADVVIPPEVKPILLPVLERLPAADTVRWLAARFPQPQLGTAGRVREILRHGGAQVASWFRAVAVDTWMRLPQPEPCDELPANLYHPDPLVAELVARALFALDPDRCRRHLGDLPEERSAALGRVLERRPDGELPLTCYGKTLELQRVPWFEHVPVSDLGRLAAHVWEHDLTPGTVLMREGEVGETVYVVLSGQLSISASSGLCAIAGPGDLLGEMAVVRADLRTATITAETPCRLLALPKRALFDLMADHPEVIPEIVRLVTERRARDEAEQAATGSARQTDAVLAAAGLRRPTATVRVR